MKKLFQLRGSESSKIRVLFPILIILSLGIGVFKPIIVSAQLSDEQRRAFESNIRYFDVQESTGCGEAAATGATVGGGSIEGHNLPATNGGVGLEEVIDAEGRVLSTGGKVTFANNAKLGQEFRDFYITMRWRYAVWNWNGTSAKGPESADFYSKAPRVLVTNPRTGKSIITVVMESGPAPWTGVDRSSNNSPKQGWTNPQDGTPPNYRGRVAGLPPVAFQAIGATQRMSDGSGDDLQYSWAPDQNAVPGPTNAAGTVSESTPNCPGGGTTTNATLPTGTDQELRTRLLNNPLLVLGAACQRIEIQSGAVKSSTILALVAIVEQAKIKVTTTALKCDHYPGTFHEQGLGADLVAGACKGPEQDKLFKFLYENRAVLKVNELIYAYPPAGTTTLDNGKAFTFDKITIDGKDGARNCLGGHEDHIHLAVNQ
ncbi:MAG: hypothetical protein V4702_05955 [Patescibacteria group bacterium]